MNIIRKIFTIVTILIAFTIYQSNSPQLHAQTLYKFSADEPSGGSSSQHSDSGNDGLYIAAGVVVAAIVGYALYKKFKKVDETDSTQTSNSTLNQFVNQKKNTFAQEIQKYQEALPVDIYFGMKNPSATIPDRTYSLGIAFKF